MDNSLPSNKIFIPVRGAPRVISNEVNEFNKLIGCKTTEGCALDYCYFGYTLAIFVDDIGRLKKLIH